jgi:hypothetical protein
VRTPRASSTVSSQYSASISRKLCSSPWVGSASRSSRLLEPIGLIPPVEFEQAYYRSSSNEPHAMVA